jgi:hypothetical protein
MPFHWSSHASHIQSVFSPWQQQDGYELSFLLVAEQALGIQLPTMLREFYRVWGRRTDLTRTRQTLFHPDHLELQSGWLLFAEESQAIYTWAIPGTALLLPDPPVYYSEPPAERGERKWTLSHRHLSDFFDYLTYGHALSHGAPYGGVVHCCSDATRIHIADIWHPIEVASAPMGVFPDPTWRWVLYGSTGLVMDCTGSLWIAAQTAALRDMVRQQLNLTWDALWEQKPRGR